MTIRLRADFCSRASLSRCEDVVVLTASQFCTGETIAILNPQHGWQTEQRFGEIGFQLVEDRLTKSSRNICRDDFRNAAEIMDALTL